MRIGCKESSKCEHIQRDYCCVDCKDFIKCEEPCVYLLDGETDKDKIITFCKLAKVN